MLNDNLSIKNNNFIHNEERNNVLNRRNNINNCFRERYNIRNNYQREDILLKI